jgi:hypothetical protein
MSDKRVARVRRGRIEFMCMEAGRVLPTSKRRKFLSALIWLKSSSFWPDAVLEINLGTSKGYVFWGVLYKVTYDGVIKFGVSDEETYFQPEVKDDLLQVLLDRVNKTLETFIKGLGTFLFGDAFVMESKLSYSPIFNRELKQIGEIAFWSKGIFPRDDFFKRALVFEKLYKACVKKKYDRPWWLYLANFDKYQKQATQSYPEFDRLIKYLINQGFIDETFCPLKPLKEIIQAAKFYLAPDIPCPICGRLYKKTRKNKHTCADKTCVDKKNRVKKKLQTLLAFNPNLTKEEVIAKFKQEEQKHIQQCRMKSLKLRPPKVHDWERLIDILWREVKGS